MDISNALFRSCAIRKCPRTKEPLIDFAPIKNPRKRAEYMQMLSILESAVRINDTEMVESTLKGLQKLAVAKCAKCRDMARRTCRKPHTKSGQCRNFWLQWKRTNSCIGCGTNRAIEADHFDPSGLIDPSNKKVHQLSAYDWWPSHGGVAAMELEAQKVVARCRCCHVIEDTGNAGITQRRINPDDLPNIPQGVDRKAYGKRHKATLTYPRMQYVDHIKRQIGKCENLDCPQDGPTRSLVVEGMEQCFDWDHIDETAKTSRVSALCCTHQKLPNWRELIDTEISKCKLLCKNCHHLKTNNELVPRYDDRALSTEAVE